MCNLYSVVMPSAHVAELQHAGRFEQRTRFGLEKAPSPSQRAGVGTRGTKMRLREMVPVAFEKSGVATGAAPLAITAARFFGLDAGDWLMMLVGLALSGLLLALI